MPGRRRSASRSGDGAARVLLAAALATGAAVATAGAIGFVGLVVPHALRRLGVRAAPLLLPASAIAGGAFVVVVDAVARTIVAPLQLPVGVLAAAIGVPTFIAMLLRSRRERDDGDRADAGRAMSAEVVGAGVDPRSERALAARRRRGAAAAALRAARSAHRRRRALGRRRPERRRQVVAARGARRRLSDRGGVGSHRRHRARGVAAGGARRAARLEPAVLVRSVSGDGARDRGARAHAATRAGAALLDARVDAEVERVLERCSLLAASPTATCRRFPAASASASRSRPRCCRARRCCCSTSRRRTSTSRTSACSSSCSPPRRRGRRRRRQPARPQSRLGPAEPRRPARRRGGAVAGRRDDVLVAERLGAVFGVAIEASTLDGARRFVVARTIRRRTRDEARWMSPTSLSRVMRSTDARRRRGAAGARGSRRVAAACARSRRSSRSTSPRSSRRPATPSRSRSSTTPATFDLERPPRAIVTLAPSLTELVFAAGGGAALVGVSALSDYPPAARAIARIGDAGRVDVERVLALRPDLVLVWQRGNTSRELEQLEARRHPPVPARAAAPRRRRARDRAPRHAARPRSRGEPARGRDARRARAAARGARRRRAGDGLLSGVAAAAHDGQRQADHQRHPRPLRRPQRLRRRSTPLVPIVSTESVVAADPEAILTASETAGRAPWRRDPANPSFAVWHRHPRMTAVRRTLALHARRRRDQPPGPAHRRRRRGGVRGARRGAGGTRAALIGAGSVAHRA